MSLFTKQTFTKNEVGARTYPNYWDLVALCVVFAIVVTLAWGATQMSTPYKMGDPIAISLETSELPYYALRSTLRMLIALAFSLLFTFIFGTWAAKSKHAERFIIPMIDILQSVPVLGYLYITVVAFIALFPGSLLGPECAAIFAIFTSQVWNMILSFYQSLRTVPADLHEASKMFHLSKWQHFWKIDVPFAMPGLLWNAMMSMSASWFFVVASEAITVANQEITLPGIGSYIFTAIHAANIHAVFYAIIAMLVVILLYDQILFRPLAVWSEKFKFEQMAEEDEPESWLVNLFQRTRWLSHFYPMLNNAWDRFVNLPFLTRRHKTKESTSNNRIQHGLLITWYILLFIGIGLSLYVLGDFVFSNVTWLEGLRVIGYGFVTGFRVMVLIALSSLIWIPLGVWIGLNPKVAKYAQPIIQFLASFPANLFFPIAVVLIITYDLNVDVWTSPLMILGTQWYIAFNVIAGTIALPKELRQATSALNVRGWLWWKRLVLPGIFPYYVTGAITAAGGAWNASIIAEVVVWGQYKLEATGLGAYIEHFALIDDFPRLTLGIVTMCTFVVVINHFLWRPLYNLAEERFSLN